MKPKNTLLTLVKPQNSLEGVKARVHALDTLIRECHTATPEKAAKLHDEFCRLIDGMRANDSSIKRHP